MMWARAITYRSRRHALYGDPLAHKFEATGAGVFDPLSPPPHASIRR